MKSYTSLEVEVLLQTTMKQGGTRIPAFSQRRRSFRSDRKGLRVLSGVAAAGSVDRAYWLCLGPFFGIFERMCSQRLRNIGISAPGMLSATGTRGNLTMPHSMASISEKSLIVHGNSVPSA